MTREHGVLAPKFVAMAQVLGELGAEIEALGEALCRDADFTARHLRELQAIDLIAQKQHALAAIVAAGFSAAQMRRINLEALRERFDGFLEDARPPCEAPREDAGREPGEPGLWE